MKHFTIYNSLGEIVSTGQVQDEDFDFQVLAPGERIVEDSADPEKDIVDPRTQKILRGGRAVKPRARTYADKRRSLYPSAIDQLDMIWRAMDSGKLPKDNEFYTTIKLIKDQYPKDPVPVINPITPKAL
jgi:hypothetical protein